jgi:hypothetical protein
MRVIAVTSSFTPEQFAAHEPAPDATVRDYDEFLRGLGAWLL